MLEETEENMKLHAASIVLSKMLEKVTKGRKLGRMTLYNCEEVIKEHRRLSKLGGIDYPEMTIMPLVRQGQLDLWRKDLTDEALQINIMNLTVKYPRILPDEIANALNYAYPGRRLIGLNLDAKQSLIKVANG